MNTPTPAKKEKDDFKINLDNPAMEPCCVDECNILPTFECQISVGDSFKIVGTVHICHPHYEFGNSGRGNLLMHSEILWKLVSKET